MAVATPQPGLFDTGPPAGSVYFLTNRNNLLRILATGMVMPHAGFAAKYYDDLLRLSPGRLPLLASAASADLVSMVVPDSQVFPVMLELRRGNLRDDAFPALLRDGTHSIAGWANPDSVMWAPSGALPFAQSVAALHFRTETEREEFEARDFADARPRSQLHRVTPNLFEGGEASADAATEWLRSLETPDGPSAEDVVAEDRRAGAVLLGCVTALPAEEEVRGWGQMIVGKKPGKQAGDTVARISRALEGTAKARDTEDVALQICIDELAATNKLEVWRPLEVLGRISIRLESQLRSKAGVMKPALDRAAAIMRDEEVFEGFKPGGSSALKALLMALRRPEPERLLGWDPGGLGSTPEVHNLAAAMVGALTGRAMMAASLREESLDDALARIEADHLSVSRDRAMPTFKPPAVAVVSLEESVSLMIDGTLVVERPIPRPTEESPQLDIPLLGDPAVREWAVAVAMRNGWGDAIESIVEAPTPEISTLAPRQTGGPITIRFSGIGSMRHDLLPDIFLAHVERGELGSEDLSRLPRVDPDAPQQRLA